MSREGYSKWKNRQNAVSKAMADFVGQHRWTHWATFTFRETQSEVSARKHFERLFEHYPRKQFKSFYYCVERGGRYDRIHGHALLNCEDSTAQHIWERWLALQGRNQVRKFNRQGGAVEYLTNYLQKGIHDWDILGKPEKDLLAVKPEKEKTPIEKYPDIALIFRKYKKGDISKDEYTALYKKLMKNRNKKR